MTKLTHKAAGTFAIAPTPFLDDGRIDDKSIDRLTDFYAEVGCDGVTVLGIMGEAPKLDGAEAEEVAKRFVKRAKNMQIIVGVSAPGFATMRALGFGGPAVVFSFVIEALLIALVGGLLGCRHTRVLRLSGSLCK